MEASGKYSHLAWLMILINAIIWAIPTTYDDPFDWQSLSVHIIFLFYAIFPFSGIFYSIKAIKVSTGGFYKIWAMSAFVLNYLSLLPLFGLWLVLYAGGV